jgi:AcrR family transcriptional regulator
MRDKYKKIMEASTKLMVQKGYHGTSIQMIADNVGITKSTIFHHFKSKEGILVAILEEAVPGALQGLKVIAQDEKMIGLDKLRRFIHYHLKMVEEKGDILNLYLSESRHLSEDRKRTYRESQRQYANFVKQIVKQIQKENRQSFRRLSPTIVSYSILGMCNWPVMWYGKRGKLGIDEIADQFYEILTKSLL